MTVLKWLVVVLFGVGGVGALGFGAMQGAMIPTSLPTAWPTAKGVALPAYPQASGVTVAGAPADAPPSDAPPADAPPADAAPADVAAKPPPEAPKDPPAEVEKPRPPPPKPEPKPEAEAKPEEPPAPKPPPKPVGEGLINLRASDTADVLVDGRKAGSSPVLGFKVKAGRHRVRFDCYDSSGNSTPGPVQSVTVQADSEADVDYDCPPAE